MTSGSYELEDLMRRRKIDIMCLQEVGWCNSGNRARSLDVNTKAYKMFYHGMKNEKNGVGIVLAAKFLESILNFKKISDEIRDDERVAISGRRKRSERTSIC